MRIDPEEARKALEQNRLRSASTPFPSAPAREDENGVYDEPVWGVDRKGVVPVPTDAERCEAISKRSGNRCLRYSQSDSNVCSKHLATVVSGFVPGGNGSVVPLGGEVEPDDLDSLRGLATSELRKILKSKTVGEAVKVQAARAVQDLVGRAGTTDNHAYLLEWRKTLALLPVEDRLAFLREKAGVGVGH